MASRVDLSSALDRNVEIQVAFDNALNHLWYFIDEIDTGHTAPSKSPAWWGHPSHAPRVIFRQNRREVARLTWCLKGRGLWEVYMDFAPCAPPKSDRRFSAEHTTWMQYVKSDFRSRFGEDARRFRRRLQMPEMRR